MQPELVQKGDRLILPCDDPAITVVPGYRRFLVGLDIAQSRDRNAYSIILDERVPRWTRYAQELAPRRRVVVKGDFLPLMPYTERAVVVRNLMQDSALRDCAFLVVDAGGPGRAFCDLLNAKSVPHTRMQIVGGESEAESKQHGVTFNNVSKNLLLGNLNSALHVGELKIGAFARRGDLQAELEAFEATVGSSGRLRIEGNATDGHLDLAMATAMAFWLTDHRTVGAHVGERRVHGYWG